MPLIQAQKRNRRSRNTSCRARRALPTWMESAQFLARGSAALAQSLCLPLCPLPNNSLQRPRVCRTSKKFGYTIDYCSHTPSGKQEEREEGLEKLSVSSCRKGMLFWITSIFVTPSRSVKGLLKELQPSALVDLVSVHIAKRLSEFATDLQRLPEELKELILRQFLVHGPKKQKRNAMAHLVPGISILRWPSRAVWKSSALMRIVQPCSASLVHLGGHDRVSRAFSHACIHRLIAHVIPRRTACRNAQRMPAIASVED